MATCAANARAKIKKGFGSLGVGQAAILAIGPDQKENEGNAEIQRTSLDDHIRHHHAQPGASLPKQTSRETLATADEKQLFLNPSDLSTVRLKLFQVATEKFLKNRSPHLGQSPYYF